MALGSKGWEVGKHGVRKERRRPGLEYQGEALLLWSLKPTRALSGPKQGWPEASGRVSELGLPQESQGPCGHHSSHKRDEGPLSLSASEPSSLI